jgi:hypothetical protein
MFLSNISAILPHSPASSKDKKGTYYSINTSGYSLNWVKSHSHATASSLASELELIGNDEFLARQAVKRSFKPVDAVSEALNEAFKAHDYNAPDNY